MDDSSWAHEFSERDVNFKIGPALPGSTYKIVWQGSVHHEFVDLKESPKPIELDGSETREQTFELKLSNQYFPGASVSGSLWVQDFPRNKWHKLSIKNNKAEISVLSPYEIEVVRNGIIGV